MTHKTLAKVRQGRRAVVGGGGRRQLNMTTPWAGTIAFHRGPRNCEYATINATQPGLKYEFPKKYSKSFPPDEKDSQVGPMRKVLSNLLNTMV